MSYTCETCNSVFRTKGNLKAHVKSAKYCITLRLTEPEICLPNSNHICHVCDNNFSNKSNLQKHLNVCSSHVGYIKYKELCIKLQATIAEKDNQILVLTTDRNKLLKSLENVSIEAIKRPTTTNNVNNNSHTTNINNLSVFVQSDLVDVIERFPITKQIMNNGVPGVAKHVGTLMKTQFVKPSYMVSNESKQKFNYKIEDGTIKKDFRSKLIIDSIGPKISDQATDIYNSTVSKYELVSKIKEFENLKIPTLKKMLRQLEQDFDEVPSRRHDHPIKVALNKQIDSKNAILIELLNELKILKYNAELEEIRLDVPMGYYEDDLDKTSQNLRKIKNLEDHNTSFSKTLIETII